MPLTSELLKFRTKFRECPIPFLFSDNTDKYALFGDLSPNKGQTNLL